MGANLVQDVEDIFQEFPGLARGPGPDPGAAGEALCAGELTHPAGQISLYYCK
jgi:hypothetical protein